MIRSLSTAATALEAQQANIERISNDLANVNTDGYKRSHTEFSELMYQTDKEPGQQVGTTSMTPVGIQTGTGVKVGATSKIFEEGPAKMTGNPLDLMIEGKGFFPVQKPNGEIAYTRNGAFHKNQQGQIVMAGGAQLIPQITLPSNAVSVTIYPNGEVRAMMPTGEENTLGQIQIITFVNEPGLLSTGSGFYKPTVASGGPQQTIPGEDGVGAIAQGQLEGSNVNVANSMVEMIQSQRGYEMGTKIMSTADQMLQSTINIK